MHARTPFRSSRLSRLLLAGCCAVAAWASHGLQAATAPATPAAGSSSKSKAENFDWWSFRPLNRPAEPAVSAANVSRVRTPIDRFILAGLEKQGLHASPEADRRTLIRRLAFDLTGLPPSPSEIEAFVADTSPGAYERVVDRLLASPQYGERWGRHWLDVVHYGETHGYDKDQPRPNAWPYRDYVIRSFNADKPYARFVEEQLAGDVLYPGTRDGFEALGFISAGPWDLIGHAEVPESKLDGQVARHLDRDDMVTTAIQSFNSLTVQCAQCHDHKFDPISQEDYYRLQAVFAAVDRADQKYDVDPAVAAKRRQLEARQQELNARKQQLEQAIAARAGAPLAELDRRIADGEKAAKSGDAFGFHSAIETRQDAIKWVQVDLGKPMPLSRVVLHPAHDDFNNIGDGFGFPLRYRIEAAEDAAFTRGVVLIADKTNADVPKPGVKAQSHEAAGRTGRFVRVTATRLAPRQEDFIFALAELEVVSAEARNVALGAAVTALDSIEAPVRWQKVNLTDGAFPGGGATGGVELVKLRETREQLWASATSEEAKRELEGIAQGLAEVKQLRSALPSQSVAYVGAVHTGSGAFQGTGGKGGKPRPVRLLPRGNLLNAGREVGPGTLRCFESLEARFDSIADRPEGERRARLARWISDSRNTLTWRSIVNRVWQYHFGRGLVETPNDFGRMGAQPSHPELLDWLAVEFRDGGQSMKALHKLIVTSATYRQVSTVDASTRAASGIDSDNRLLWRQNRRKLEAEAVRDAVLAVSGKLDLTMGGPSFRDFVLEKPEHSPHYEYQLHDPEDPKSHRRSAYRFIVRSQQQPFLTVLDCADPSMQVGRRNESVSPLQALALLNNPLMLTMSRHFAESLQLEGGDLATQVDRGHRRALGRPPSAAEREMLVAYATRHGLANCCRLMLNLNEFAFVD
jgi:hypothetical protein